MMCTIPTVTVDMCPSNQRPTTTITAMVAAGRNGHMAPRMRPFVPHQCVRLIDDDPQARRHTFYGDWKSFWLIVVWYYLLRRQWQWQRPHSSFRQSSLSPRHRHHCVPLLSVVIARHLIHSYPSFLCLLTVFLLPPTMLS